MAWKTKEQAKAYNDAYRKKHREKLAQDKRDRYASDPEKYRKARKEWRDKNPYRSLQLELKNQAKIRAREQNVPFDISADDIEIPDVCPILGIKLERNTKSWAHDASPTLDKIVSNSGYVRGNIAVISHRANVIKGNSTLEELAAVLKFYS